MPATTHTPKKYTTAFNAGLAIAALWRQHHAADIKSATSATHAARQAALTRRDNLFAQVTEATHQACRAECETPADIAAMAVTCHEIGGLVGLTEGPYRKRCVESLLAATAKIAIASAKLGAVQLSDLATAHEARQINRLARAV